MEPTGLRDSDGSRAVTDDGDDAYERLCESSEFEDDMLLVSNFETHVDGEPKGYWAQWCDRDEYGTYLLSLDRIDQIDVTGR